MCFSPRFHTFCFLFRTSVAICAICLLPVSLLHCEGWRGLCCAYLGPPEHQLLLLLRQLLRVRLSATIFHLHPLLVRIAPALFWLMEIFLRQVFREDLQHLQKTGRQSANGCGSGSGNGSGSGCGCATATGKLCESAQKDEGQRRPKRNAHSGHKTLNVDVFALIDLSLTPAKESDTDAHPEDVVKFYV